MRRVTVLPGGAVVVVEADRPVPGPEEVLVESRVVGVCGSDTHAAAGKHPFIALPYNPGHEVGGVVLELGAAVTEVAVGTGSSSSRRCRAGTASGAAR